MGSYLGIVHEPKVIKKKFLQLSKNSEIISFIMHSIFLKIHYVLLLGSPNPQ